MSILRHLSQPPSYPLFWSPRSEADFDQEVHGLVSKTVVNQLIEDHVGEVVHSSSGRLGSNRLGSLLNGLPDLRRGYSSL